MDAVRPAGGTRERRERSVGDVDGARSPGSPPGAGGRGALRGAATLALLLVVGCSVSTSRVIEPGERGGEAGPLARRAEEAFGERPRTVEAVLEAFRTMSAAARKVGAGDARRHQYSARAARFAVWLAEHVEDEDRSESFADTALVFANTAVRVDSSRVEGFYWRAIATGIVARHNRLTLGRSAMTRIQEDATEAVRIDPTFQHGGPHRVLGGLYLRAPGPPTGVGSLRRALHHLERARELAPDHPDNLLLLAEAYLEAGREEEAVRLLNDVLSSEIPYGDPAEREAWRDRAQTLLEELK